VLGQAFAEVPPVFAEARTALVTAGRVGHWGFASSRAEYAAVLAGCDVVVSTAAHEFFGVAVAEGVAAGCWPLCPDALAYPEVFATNSHEAAASGGAAARAAAVLREVGQRGALAELLAPAPALSSAQSFASLSKASSSVGDGIVSGSGDNGTATADVYAPPSWLRLSGSGSGAAGGCAPPPRKSPFLYACGAAGLAACLLKMQRELSRVRAWREALQGALRAAAAASEGLAPPKRAREEGGGVDEWGSAASAAVLAARSFSFSAGAMETPFATLLLAAPPPPLNYSLWLRFEPTAHAALQGVVDSLAAAHGTLPFVPHITVVPQFAIPAERRGAVVEALRAFARRTPPLRVFSEGVEAGSNPAHWRWRCVYAVCRKEGALMDLSARARDALGLPPAVEPYFPHASVVYSDCGAEKRAAIREAVAARVGAALEGGAMCGALEVWETTVEGGWRLEEAFSLGAAV
jgi:2'-5' RNA ligase